MKQGANNMEFIGGISGANFKPITEYNKYLKNNESFDIDSDLDFENVLNKQTSALQSPLKVDGQIEMNNFDDVVAKNSVQGVDEKAATGDFLKNFGNAIGSGLNKTNDAVVKADEAQEAFAAGENVSVHDVMLAAEKSTLSMAMTMQLRNKLIQAYNEINGVRV